MPAALAVRELVKRYGDITAVAGVSFEVAAGEIFGLLGPNGAGKTTTIECILGLRRRDSGAIAIGDIDTVAHPDRAKEIVGAQLQGTALQDKITPRQAIGLFGSFYKNAADAVGLIERFGLAEKADSPFDSLSAGQQQRLGMALAFVNDPQLVFLDEPTAGLDPTARRQLHQIILGMRSAGRAVVMSTHYIEEAEHLCDRVAIMHHGRIVAVGTPRELIERGSTGGKRPSLEDVFIEMTGDTLSDTPA